MVSYIFFGHRSSLSLRFYVSENDPASFFSYRKAPHLMSPLERAVLSICAL